MEEKEKTMTHAEKTLPEPQAILQAWLPFRKTVGIASIHDETDYRRAQAIANALLETIGDDEDHPLAEVLDYLSGKIETYEEKHFPIPEAEPKEVLRLLMEQHRLKQEDLTDCAPQSRISEILAGRRGISKETAKKLAQRFHVEASLFL
jgi:HTH-type transcriptional regulator/antitoxin HigA